MKYIIGSYHCDNPEYIAENHFPCGWIEWTDNKEDAHEFESSVEVEYAWHVDFCDRFNIHQIIFTEMPDIEGLVNL